ncbi:MAG: SCO family protein [Nitrospirae bacterium]|nr:SCO family protein [Nitrospirota bacterium]
MTTISPEPYVKKCWKLSTGLLIPAAVILFFLFSVETACSERQGPSGGAGIDEKLGEVLPLEITFTDEQGRQVLLRDLITRPTVLNFVYYSCGHACPALLSGLSDAISRVELTPGKDFNVVTISFDETDTPDRGAQKKADHTKASGREFPGSSWTFLTGNKESIAKITEAAGFGFRRAPNGFAHPVALIVLSPQAKITRYLYGIKFLPMDLTLAITEASKGLAVPTVNKVLLYCYSYDPGGRRYVFNVLKITAAATIIFVIIFIGWLTLSSGKGGGKAEIKKGPTDA